MEEIVWGGEEREGEEGWLMDGEGEVCEDDGGMGREEEGAVVVVVVVGEGRWVDGASGGGDGGSGVVLGSEEWTTAERDDVETGHTQGGVDEGEAYKKFGSTRTYVKFQSIELNATLVCTEASLLNGS
ncbi:uncharacterized protein MONOS_16987 [Monocercomonoides exilis]|uniref:uncharacterized protein n=1 Tax=Monocercomonoides exilis TaxID=2049356 RepID=UPI0035596164|nr:hypothetical protein MONOS_16987 [Monocercomonoides exilis]